MNQFGPGEPGANEPMQSLNPRAGASAAGREVELKLAFGSDTARRMADRELGEAPARMVETIYFDTPKHRLRAAGCSLRLRRDGDRWLQTVKSGDGVERYEHERELAGDQLDLAMLAGTPIAGVIGDGRDLAPLFLTRVSRRTVERQTARSRVELSLDVGELVVRDHAWPILELELELKSGRRDALFAQARRLAKRAAFTPAFESKAERGYALAGGVLGRPAKFEPRPLHGDMSAAQAFQALAQGCLRQLAINAALIAGEARIEAVHQARVALRRLRVAMGLFAPLLAGGPAIAVERELVWLTVELADARNLDVFINDTFLPAAEDLADRFASVGLEQALLAAQEVAYARATAAVGSARFRLLLLDAAAWIDGVGSGRAAPGAAAPLRRFASDALDQRRRVLRRRVRGLDWSDPIAGHKLRIQAKKMRYASEFFSDLARGGDERCYDAFIAGLERVQSKLGRLNDISVGEQTVLKALEGMAEGPPTPVSYVAGLIIGKSQGQAPRLIKSAKRRCRDLLKCKVWW